MEALHALWTFPAIIFAALLIAWAAECGQFYISQGLALAVLALVQTLPEFAVEATIAWEAASDPSKVHLVIANFTGSLRLFVGLGWPTVYFICLACNRKTLPKKWTIRMEDEQSISVLTLLPAIGYFTWIYFKGTLNLLDSTVLVTIYIVYLLLLFRLDPQDHEGIEDLDVIPRKMMRLPKMWSVFTILACFTAGGALLYFCAHPFFHSMLAVATMMGVSQFVFVQWIAPFLSEFPEQLSAFKWAKSPKKAPLSLSNFVSSSINQWTVLTAMVPVVYSLGSHAPSEIIFDSHQRVEILLTIVQSYLGFLFLASMDFALPEACGLAGLWLAQFFIPGIREEIIWIYAAWAVVETVRFAARLKQRNVFHAFSDVLKRQNRAA